eukprot:2845455-Rhodomonas_salina.1
MGLFVVGVATDVQEVEDDEVIGSVETVKRPQSESIGIQSHQDDDRTCSRGLGCRGFGGGAAGAGER